MSNQTWVAYNGFGDLVATGGSYGQAVRNAYWAGYDEDECLIGRVTD